MAAQNDTFDRIRRATSVTTAVRDGHDSAVIAHGGIDVAFELFLDEVLVRALRRLDRAQLQPSVENVDEILTVTAFEDLYLVVACRAECRGRLAMLDRHVRTANRRSRALDRHAEAVSQPRPRPARRSCAAPWQRCGTDTTRYVRRGGQPLCVAGRDPASPRSHARAPKDEAPHPRPRPAALDDRHASAAQDPFAALVDAEEGMRIVHALQDGWRSLSTREQLALHFRFGESLKLKDIGKLLGLTESGTSRVVAGALESLRQRARRVARDGAIPPARLQLWSALWHAVSTEGDRGAGTS